MDIQVNGLDEREIVQAVVNQVSRDSINPLLEHIKIQLQPHDELVGKQAICDRVLHCDVGTLNDFYMYQPDFPYSRKGTRLQFSLKAVDQWIANNQERVAG
ncbi:DNA-binding protein [Furfurilactobacillus sp. WILCCON 0119]